MKKNTRNLGLDILRLIAIISVALHHARPCPTTNGPLCTTLSHFWIEGGWIGVDLFFVLSGYLVSGLLFDEYQRYGDIWYTNFLARRGFKIYPAFWALLLITILFKLALKQPVIPQELLGELLFLQNYIGSIWLHTWSLAVEEHFYIGLCLLFFLLLKYRPSRDFIHIPLIFAITAITCLWLRGITVMLLPQFDHLKIIAPTHLRIDSLMFGVLIAWAWRYRSLQQWAEKTPSWLLIIGGFLCYTPAFFFPRDESLWLSIIGLSLFYLGSGVLMLGMITTPFERIPFASFCANLGFYSYSVYLWHSMVNNIAFTIFDPAKHYYLYLITFIVGMFVCGIGMAKLVEMPFLKLRDRYFPSRHTVMKRMQMQPISAD